MGESSRDKTKAFLWLDLETTGSDSVLDPILEIGVVATDLDLNQLKVGGFDGSLDLVCELTAEGKRRMDKIPAIVEMHTKNGLLNECILSARTVSMADAHLASWLSMFSEEHGIKKHQWMIAGSGVAHFDRAFVRQQLPLLDKWLWYPALDIGVLRRALYFFGAPELVPDLPDSHGATKTHRALDDVYAHLREARAYKYALSAVLKDARTVSGDTKSAYGSYLWQDYERTTGGELT